jgi:hypothetical protein
MLSYFFTTKKNTFFGYPFLERFMGLRAYTHKVLFGHVGPLAFFVMLYLTL